MRSSVAKEKTKDKNTTVVRLKREGIRFELMLHRDHIPSKADLKDPKFVVNFDELLVNDAIFTNAAKNEIAKPADVEKAFHDAPNTNEGKDVRAVMHFILAKGDIQKSQEDRTEEMEEALQLVSKLAQKIASSTHVYPEDAIAKFVESGRKNPEKLSSTRMERYAAADIERELKNIKFRATQSADLNDLAADAIHALWANKELLILRDAHLVVVQPHGATTIADIHAAVKEHLPHGYYKLLAAASGAKEVRLLIDATAKGVLPKAAFGEALVEVGKEVHVPRSDDEELAAVAPGVAAPAATAHAHATGGKGGAKATQPKPAAKVAAKLAAKGAKPTDASSGDDEARSALEEQLAKLKAEDSDDDGPKKGGKKGGKKAAAPAAKAPAPKAKAAAPQQAGRKNRELSDKDVASSSEDDAPTESMKPKKRK